MKEPKPGQFVSVSGTVYRACKSELGCKGCDLNSIQRCPMIVDKRFEQPEINCRKYDIILKSIRS
jgi:hypothetical protein